MSHHSKKRELKAKIVSLQRDNAKLRKALRAEREFWHHILQCPECQLQTIHRIMCPEAFVLRALYRRTTDAARAARRKS